MRVLIFGDSITYGAWDSHGGWADRLKQKVHQKAIDDHADGAKTFQLLNVGISGDTSRSLLHRFEPEIQARQSKTRPSTIFICIGANDTLGHPSLDDVNISLNEYRDNITKLIAIARKYSDKIYLVGLPCLGDETVEFIGMHYSRERIKTYDDACRAICEQEQIPFIDIFTPYTESKDITGLYSEDLLHPNDAGHELIAETVWPELQKILIR